MKTALTILQQQFRFPSFRAGQSEIIENILEGKNVLAVMPTGSGKSLTYQILSLLLDGVTVVISPLIALMKDQVDFAYEIKEGWATFINSSIPYALQEKRTREILEGKYRLVYIAPERLRSRKFINALKFMNISLLVIDEAHCISFWGHDFRPDYLYIKEARKRIKNHKILALTATATPNIQDEIIKELNIEKPFKVVLGFDRPNLKLEVINTPTIKDKYEKLLSRIKELNGSGIIYTGTRQEAEEVDQFL
ncbi:RecQ family ATP-dependent DNA helicase [candidate division WOR-3 bacterium]|nr:RecQ family ATP-dependent DNA helicase [candidate division WOR-3 bacterium]